MKIKFILAFFVLDLFLVANAFAQEPKKGDVTGDGTIGIFDLIEVKDYTNKEMAEISASEQAVADFNSDGRIDELDVADMRNYINSQETQKDRVDFIVRVKFAIDPQTGTIFKPKSVVSTYTGQIAQIEDIVNDFVKSLKVTGQIVDPPCDIGDTFKVKAKWPSISKLDSSFQTSVFVNVKKLTNNTLLKEDVNVVTKHVPESCNVFTSTSDIELISCDPFFFSVDLWASAVKITEGLTPLAQADLNVQSSPENINSNLVLISVVGKNLEPPCAKGDTYRVTALWESKDHVPCWENLYAEVAELTNGTLISYTLEDGGKDGVLSHGESLIGTFDIRLESCEKFRFNVNIFASFKCGPFNAGEPVSGPLKVDENEKLDILLPETTFPVTILGITILVTIPEIKVGDLEVHLKGTLSEGEKANPMTLEARLVPPSETIYKFEMKIGFVTIEADIIFEERFLLNEEDGIIGWGKKRDFRYIECIGNCTKTAGEKDVFKLPFRYNLKLGSIGTITDVVKGILTIEKPQDNFICCE